MRSLFLKIFLWFVLAMALVMAALLLSVAWTRLERPFAPAFSASWDRRAQLAATLLERHEPLILAAYLQTLEEASWPAITYAGSVLRLDWRASRRCTRCGRTFKPMRRDQKWCTDRCRWAASKARAR